jgi:hypothetical protein
MNNVVLDEGSPRYRYIITLFSISFLGSVDRFCVTYFGLTSVPKPRHEQPYFVTSDGHCCLLGPRSMRGAVLQRPQYTCGYSVRTQEVVIAMKPVAVKPVSVPRLTVFRNKKNGL